MAFTFDETNTFRNVGIGTTNNKIIIMNVSKSSDNLSFHSTTNDTSVDIMSIKTILNKDDKNDLNISAFDGNTINPIIQINNTNQHININSNLNINSNVNIIIPGINRHNDSNNTDTIYITAGQTTWYGFDNTDIFTPLAEIKSNKNSKIILHGEGGSKLDIDLDGRLNCTSFNIKKHIPNNPYSTMASISGEGEATFGTLAAGNTTITGTASISSTLSAGTGSTIGNLTLANGSITDSSGSINFSDENLTTTGTLSAGDATFTKNITLNTDSSSNNNELKLKTSATNSSTTSKITFERGDSNIYTQIFNRNANGVIRTVMYSKNNIEFMVSDSTTDIYNNDKPHSKTRLLIYSDSSVNNGKAVKIKGHTTIEGNLTLTNGSITDSSGSIDFSNENLTTTGTLTAGNTTINGTLNMPSIFNIYTTAQTVTGGKTYKLSCEDGLIMNNHPILLMGDSNHYIKGRSEGSGRDNIDGVEISGAGDGNNGDNPRAICRIVQNATPLIVDNKIIEIYRDRIDLNKNTSIDGTLSTTNNATIGGTLSTAGNTTINGTLSMPSIFNIYTTAQTVTGGKTYKLSCGDGLIMNNHPILLKSDSYHYIMGKSDGGEGRHNIDGVQISGYGGGQRACFRVVKQNLSTGDRPDSNRLFEVFTDLIYLNRKTNIYHRAPYLSVGANVGQSSSDDGTNKWVSIESGALGSWYGKSGNFSPILTLKSSSYGRVFMYSDADFVELHTDGGAYHNGNYQGSDDRFKSNEVALTNCLQTILKLQPEIYTKEFIKNMTRNIGECPTYIDDNGDTIEDTANWPKETYSVKGQKSIESGFIAQDTYNNVPELRHLVSLDETLLNNPNNFDAEGKLVENVVDNAGNPSYLYLNYIGIIPYLAGAIKEMNSKINTLETENNELKSIINNLKNSNSFEEFKQTF